MNAPIKPDISCSSPQLGGEAAKLRTLLFFVCSASCLLFSAPLAHADITSGLVGYWTFDGKNTNWNTNTTLDKSGNGNTATMTNMSTTSSPVIGKVGQGLRFDGVDDYVIANVNGTTLTQLTVSFWVSPTLPATQQGIFQWANTLSSGAPFILFTKKSNNDSQLYVDGNYQITTVLSNAKWNYVTIVLNTSNLWTLYVNGVSVGTYQDDATHMWQTEATSLYFGNGFVDYFKGSLDDFRVYNRALSTTDIQQLYTTGATKLGVTPANSLTSGLVGYWTFDGKDTNWSTGKTNDLSGNGNTGTMTNMSTSSTPVVGKVGQGFKFDSVDDYVDLSSSVSNFSNLNTGTISFWFKANKFFQAPRLARSFISMTDDSQSITNLFAIRVFQDSNQLQVLYNNNPSFANVFVVPKPGTWNNFVYVTDSTGSFLYLNGNQYFSTTTANILFSQVTSPTQFRIGALGGTSLRDTMDDVRIYNRALSASEITKLYNLGSAKLGVSPTKSLTSGLVGYWTFDGKDTNWSTGKTNDVSGNGNNGTMTNISTSTGSAVGKVGQALKFYGTTDHVDINNALLSSTVPNGFSIFTWAKSSKYSAYVWEMGGSDSNNLTFGAQGLGPNCHINNLYQTPNFAFDTTKWHNYGCVLDRNTNVLTLYIDSASTTSVSISGFSSFINYDGLFHLGGRIYENNSGINGSLDDFRIYNRTLSQAEIQKLYNLGSPLRR